MGLARVYLVRIIAALLPRNVREHVLGDLAERGYNFHDIANVLPGVWWSYFRRITGIPFVEGSTDAAFERRFNQFSRETGIAIALIYLSWSVIVTIVYRGWYLILVFIVLTGIAVWPYFLSFVRRRVTIAPRCDGTWRERYTFRLRGQRAILFWTQIGMLFLDTLGRTVAVHNGKTWPLTGPHLELPLANLTLNLSISTLLVCFLHFLWAYRIHRELRKLESS